MEPRILTTQQLLRRPRREVFDFFADAGNLEAITPPSLRFRILTPQPIEMRRGALIDYRLRLRRIPVSWRTEITVWQPPYRFVDEQLRGPYRQWIHEHTFEDHVFDDGEAGTRVRDRVQYALPLNRLPGTGLIHRWFVRPELERIFEYRQRRIEELLGDAG